MQASRMKVGKDREKKKKKRIHHKESADSSSIVSVDSIFNLPGVLKVVLSTISQKAIGCVLGEDITSDDPWILIKKEKIEDNIELHEESSEFLPIKQSIIEYSEEEILMGFDKPLEDGKLEFFLCATKNAKQEVQTILERQKIELQERLKKSILKSPGKWESYGSETEVDENIIKNFRPLIEVEIDTKYPFSTEKKKFKLRLVEDSIDGYVELLPSRFPITNVYRKRLDAGIQVTPQTRENETQTHPIYPQNKWTQYKYEYTEPKLSKDQNKNLVKFITEQAEHLNETIHVNEHINLYTDEYMKNHRHIITGDILTNRDLLSFRHVIACKSKVVTDVALDPFYSGILAAAYGKYSFNHFITGSAPNEAIDEVNECTFDPHLVLIWCNTDPLNPKLYLHSNREVRAVRHCPSRPDILIGGCENGQIILWDTSGKLQSVETMEMLTPRERKHRSVIQSYMTWMKNIPDINIVLPTLVSSLEHSHKNTVTDIKWILPNYKMTRNGKILKCNEEEESLQFMSSSLDGSILIWDLLSTTQIDETSRPKKSSRLKKRPSALETNISEFRHLHLILTPIYKINLHDNITQLPFPLSCINIKNKNFEYVARNPETEKDCLQRTYFDNVKSIKQYTFDYSIQITDMLGHFFHTKFEGHDFDQGQKINFENIQYRDFQLVHDGPLKCCLSNVNNANLFLTIGGRVFAVWNVAATQMNKPVFWRKNNCRYVGGVWSSQQFGSVVLQREDSFVETWTLLQKTNGPDRVVRMSGNAPTDYFSDITRRHVKKFTICTADVVGAVRIYRIPPVRWSLDLKILLELAQIISERFFARKITFAKWLQTWKSKHQCEIPEQEQKQQQISDESKEQEQTTDAAAIEEKTPATECEKENNKKKKIEIKNPSIRLQERQEKIMHEILLQKKRINIDEIEKHKKPLQEMMLDQKQKMIKAQEILAKKDEIFDVAKKNIFKDAEIKKSKKFRISLPDEARKKIKQKYKEGFIIAKENVLNHITEHNFHFKFKWDQMMTHGKERRRTMSISPSIETRKQRFSTLKKSINLSTQSVKFTAGSSVCEDIHND